MKRSLTRKQANQLCKTVGQMLVAELATTNVKGKADKLVAEYVKANKLDADPPGALQEPQMVRQGNSILNSCR